MSNKFKLRTTYSGAQTSAGSTQATAAPLISDHVGCLTVGAGEGVIIPAASADDEFIVINGSSTQDLRVYPPVGGKLNNAAANLHMSIAPNRACRFICHASLNFTVSG